MPTEEFSADNGRQTTSPTRTRTSVTISSRWIATPASASTSHRTSLDTIRKSFFGTRIIEARRGAVNKPRASDGLAKTIRA